MIGRYPVALVGLSLLLGGCGNSAPVGNGARTVQDGPAVKLRVAKIDTARVMADMKEYKELESAMVKDKTAYYATLPKDPRNIDKAKADQMRVNAQAKQGEWQKKISEMTQTSIKLITEQTAEVARVRNLDMVVVDTPYSHTIQYIDGPDVSTDVILKLKK